MPLADVHPWAEGEPGRAGSPGKRAWLPWPLQGRMGPGSLSRMVVWKFILLLFFVKKGYEALIYLYPRTHDWTYDRTSL